MKSTKVQTLSALHMQAWRQIDELGYGYECLFSSEEVDMT